VNVEKEKEKEIVEQGLVRSKLSVGVELVLSLRVKIRMHIL